MERPQGILEEPTTTSAIQLDKIQAAGLAGGDWTQIQTIIETTSDIFPKVDATVYSLEGENTKCVE